MAGEQERLDELKAQCVEGETGEQHAAHAEALTAAYTAFASRDVATDESNPAPPGETFVDAAIVVTADTEPPQS